MDLKHLIRKWIKDEIKVSQVYRRWGLEELARDEEEHARVLRKMLR